MRARRGLSLIEVMIVSSLFVVFSGLVLGALDTGRSLFSRSLEGARQRDVLRVLNQISARARFSHPSSLGAQPWGVSLASAYDPAGGFRVDPANGRPLWQGHDLYFLKEGDLYGAYLARPTQSEPGPLESEARPQVEARLLLTDVDSFRVEKHQTYWRLRLQSDGKEFERWIVPVN